MKNNRFAKIALVILCLLLCAGTLCSCMNDVADEDKDAVESAKKRKVSLRSDEEIAETGLTAEDVLAAFDNFLAAEEEKSGGQEKVRFLSVTGQEVDVSLDEFGPAQRKTIDFFPLKQSENLYVNGSRQYEYFDHPVTYFEISIREVKQHLMVTRTANMTLCIPIEILEPVLSAFCGEKIEYLMATDIGDMASDSENRLFYLGVAFGANDYYWHCPEIGESQIREASSEQLDILYTFVKELYKVVIDEDYSKYTEYVESYYRLSGGTPIFRKVPEWNSSEKFCRGVKLDKNDMLEEFCFFGDTHGKYVYSYNENGEVTEITEMLYSDHGILESTNTIPLETASQIVVHCDTRALMEAYQIETDSPDSDLYVIDSIVSIVPEKIGYQCDGSEHIYGLNEEHPADSILIYGLHVVILVNGEQYSDICINLHTLREAPAKYSSRYID